MSLFMSTAIDGLFAVWGGLNVPNLEVSDGPNYDPKRSMLLAVGWDGADGAESASEDLSIAGPRLQQSACLVNCWLSVHRGVSTATEARQAIVGLFATLDAALAADRTLRGKVTSARVRTVTLHQGVAESRSLAGMRLAVAVTGIA